MSVIYAICIPIVFFAIIAIAMSVNKKNAKEPYHPQEIEYPGKCFSCERELPKELKYLGQATKCFSCEREMARVSPHAAMREHKNKCYSCESPP